MMTRLTTLLLLAPLLGTLAPAQESKPLPADKPATKKPARPLTVQLGDSIPAGMTLRSLTGEQVRLDEFSAKGRVVVLHFWSTTCPYEKAAEPKLNQLRLDYADKDVVLMGIAANQNEIGNQPPPAAFEPGAKNAPYGRLRKAAKTSQLNHSVLVDHGGKLGKLLMAKTTPHCYVFDKKGKLVYTGALDDNPRKPAINYVRDAVESVLANEQVETASTPPYG